MIAINDSIPLKKNRCRVANVEVLESFEYPSALKYFPWWQPKSQHCETSGYKYVHFCSMYTSLSGQSLND